MKHLFLLAWLLLGAGGAWGQALLSGVVRDSLTQQPLPQASVFILNTTLGTTTDAQGRFVLHKVPPSRYVLAATYLGYRLRQQLVEVAERPLTTELQLAPTAQALGNVVVRGRPTQSEYLPLFKQVFLGGSSFSQRCRVRNPAVLAIRYDPVQQRLEAAATDALEVDNQALGYRLTFYNLVFRADFVNETVYATTQMQVKFQELVGSPTQARHWATHRERAYRGSLLHFLRAAYAGQLLPQGFRLQRLQRLPNRRWAVADSTVHARQTAGEQLALASLPAATWRHLLEPPTLSVLHPAQLPPDSVCRVDSLGQVRLCFRDFLAVTYGPEPIDPNYRLPGAFSGKRQYLLQESVLRLRQPSGIELAPNGLLARPLDLPAEGYWGFEKIGELLPLDYEPPGPAGEGRR